MKPTSTLILSLLFLLGGCGGPGPDTTLPQAQPAGASSSDIGDHIVHFSAMTTDHLPREVASAYNIQRSKSVAMLNVAVIEEATGKPVHATVDVVVRNLANQIKNVAIREIVEQEAIYYIGDTSVTDRETLVFDISVRPEGVSEASEVSFTREFYTK